MREIAQGLRFQSSTISFLQEASEAYLVGLFEDTPKMSLALPRIVTQELEEQKNTKSRTNGGNALEDDGSVGSSAKDTLKVEPDGLRFSSIDIVGVATVVDATRMPGPTSLVGAVEGGVQQGRGVAPSLQDDDEKKRNSWNTSYHWSVSHAARLAFGHSDLCLCEGTPTRLGFIPNRAKTGGQ